MIDSFYDLVQEHMRQHRFEEALAVLEMSEAQACLKHGKYWRMKASVLENIGHSMAAMQAFKSALKINAQDAQAHIGLAQLYHSNAQLNEAIEHYEAAIKLQCAQKLTAIENIEYTPFDTQLAESCLFDILTALYKYGIHAFPIAGSLLGLVREGRLLKHDKDIDIGLPFIEMLKAAEVMQERGWERLHSMQGLINPQSWRHSSGLILDFVGFAADGQKLISGFWYQSIGHPWNRILEYPEIPLKVQFFDQGEYWYPSQPEILLETLYGSNWQTPDPIFDTIVGAHNLREFSLLVRCYALQRIYRDWVLKRFDKAYSLVVHSLRHSPDNPLFQQIQQALEDHASTFKSK